MSTSATQGGHNNILRLHECSSTPVWSKYCTRN